MLQSSYKYVRKLKITSQLRSQSRSASYLIKNNQMIINGKINVNTIMSRHVSSNDSSAVIKRIDLNTSSNLNDTFEQSLNLFSDRNAVGTYNVTSGNYEWVTFSQLGALVNDFRKVLYSHNIDFSSKVAIISNNRLEWIVVAYAAFSLGAQIVPMYEAQLEKDWKYIVENSDAKLLVVANESIYNKVKGYAGQIGVLQSILSFDSPSDQINSYSRWMSLAKADKEVARQRVSEEDIAVIIYTSGTTGNPKGVELSHKNILTVMRDVATYMGDNIYNHTSLAILPWAHVYGQVNELHSSLAVGSAMAIVPNRELLMQCLRATKPTMITAVPTLLNKIYDGVYKQIAENPSKISKSIFNWAISVARSRTELLSTNQPVGFILDLKYRVADALVFKKIKQAFGGRLKFFCLGGAATSIPVIYFFEGLGIPVLEGYGLTETAPVISFNRVEWKNRKIGYVGRPISSLSVKIVDPGTLDDVSEGSEGEIAVSGPSVMIGYRKNPDANKAVFFVKDGLRYFRTGDLGRLDKDGFLKVTGRIKEQYKLENGKYVVPTPVEDTLSRSLYIAQALIYGDNKPYNVALVVPDFVEIKSWCEKRGIKIPSTGHSDIYKHESVVNLIKLELNQVSSVLKSYEKPHAFAIIAEPFSQDNQMLTPKMSLRRNNILKAYESVVDGLYKGTEGYSLISTNNGGDTHP